MTFSVQLRHIHKESIPTFSTILVFICRSSSSYAQRRFTLELVRVVTTVVVLKQTQKKNKHNNSCNHMIQF